MTISTNELMLVSQTLIILLFIQIVFTVRKSFLFAAIAVCLILVSILGSNLINVFGSITNSGNVFYAAVFFTTQLIVENYGKKEAYKSIFLGASAILLFMIMAQLALLQISAAESKEVELALQNIFSVAPRVAFASIIAYIASSTINIELFSYLKETALGKLLPLRVFGSNAISQLVDSIIFFCLAFAGSLPAATLFQIASTGYLVKIGVGCVSILFFYLQTNMFAFKKPHKDIHKDI